MTGDTTDSGAEPKGAASAARLRNRRNNVTIAAGIKLTIFTVASLLVTGLLAAIMGNFGFGAATTYEAIFSNASMLKKGDDVRVAGVSVGEVKKVEHYHRTQAKVTFRVKSDLPLTTASEAAIRYLNLVGDRYLALEEGADSGASPLRAGGTIALDHTTPALDLTTLFNGFKPLFSALDPKQINDLSMNLVQVLQGEGGTVQALLAKTASLTNSLADRDQLIGEVITNLDTTLTTVDKRHVQLSQLIVSLKDWLADLARDRHVIGGSISQVGQLTDVLAHLLSDGRPLLKTDIAQLRTLASTLNEKQNTQIVTELLDRLPESVTDQTRTGTYGSWYNYYLCGFSGKITLPDVLQGIPGLGRLEKQLEHFEFHSTAARCAR